MQKNTSGFMIKNNKAQNIKYRYRVDVLKRKIMQINEFQLVIKQS